MTSKRWTAALLLILILGAYVAAGLLGITAHEDPTEMDTVPYLRLALWIKEHGGVAGWLAGCLNGSYREATQHPLYVLFLSGFAENSPRFFVTAKIVSGLIGMLLLAAAAYVAWRLFGIFAAVFTGLVLVTQATFVSITTVVACEGLLALFILLFGLYASEGFLKPAQWYKAGVAAGLGFLTKSIAILCLPAFGLAVVFRLRKQLFKRAFLKPFIGFFACFLAVASPLFVRNTLVYGTPLYSNSSAVLWMEYWLEYDQMVDRGEKSPGPAEYIQKRGIKHAVYQISAGSAKRVARILDDGFKPLPLWKHFDRDILRGFYKKTMPGQWVWSYGMVFLIAAATFAARKRDFTFVWLACLAVFVPFVGFYSKVFPGNPPTRLLFPMLVLGTVMASSWAERLNIRPAYKTGIAALCGVLVLAGLGMNLVSQPLNLSKSYRFNPFFLSQLQWAVKKYSQERFDKLLVGHMFEDNLFYFRKAVPFEVSVWPYKADMDSLKESVHSQNADYGILDIATAVNQFTLWKPYYELGPYVGMRQTRALPDWMTVLPRPKEVPPFYELFQFEKR